MSAQDPRPGEDHIRRTKKLVEILLPPLREIARRHGYALAVHGSLERDIDLIAVPWREGPSCALDLVTNFYALCEAVHGHATGPGGWRIGMDFEPPTGSLFNPTPKPHGRLGWIIQIGAHYLDGSVMPLVPMG